MRAIHPRLRFSLRMLFAPVTLIGGWLGYHINWMNQRHDAIRRFDLGVSKSPTIARAPFGLRILGERGESWIVVGAEVTKSDVERLQKLFPEAEINAPDWDAILDAREARNR